MAYIPKQTHSAVMWIEGEGYHHRRVKANDAHKWKKRDVNLMDA